MEKEHLQEIQSGYQSKRKWLAAISVVIVVILAVLVTLFIWNWLASFSQEDFRAYIQSFGPLGWLVLLGLQFLQVFIDAYEEAIGGELTGETMPKLNGYQISLLAYHYFRREVNEGGFVQLIYNGYGSFIFENPFAKAMRMMGAREFSKLVYSARKVYEENKEELTREKTDEEFMATYERFEAFDKLEEEFMEMEEYVTATLASYVDEHIGEFGEVVD